MTLREFLNTSTALLKNAHVDAPRLSAQVITAHVLGWTKLDQALYAESPLPTEHIPLLQNQILRRSLGEPVAYITGQKDFFGRAFCVDTSTLIPRPETEELVEALLQAYMPAQASFADIGTGSGCIAITMACQRPKWHGIMVDISPAALQMAQKNIRVHRVDKQLQLVQANLYNLPLATESLNILISNPPYVSDKEYDTLDPQVRNFEPAHALVPDFYGEVSHTKKNTAEKSFSAKGLEHIKALAHTADQFLRPGGLCFVEHGATQGKDVWQIFSQNPVWADIKICQDMAGLDRFCFCSKKM